MQNPSPTSSSPVLHVEFRVSWLIAQLWEESVSPGRRLTAIESLVSCLGRPWRSFDEPIRPARDLRMSERTREMLMEWVQSAERAGGATLARVGVYASGATSDDRVPDGWMRLMVHTAARAA
jgi:hypothetical protein